MLSKIVNKILEVPGYKLIKSKEEQERRLDIDTDDEFLEIYNQCKDYTMTSIERMYALYCAGKHIIKSGLSGDFIECGVWRGGSSMLLAHILVRNSILNRKIYLYDTFEGMPRPNDIDVSLIGDQASTIFEVTNTGTDSSTWCFASIDEVRDNILSTGLKEGQFKLIKGKVEETIPTVLPENGISLLRLDTDWYSSTKHELNHLYPLVNKGGVLIIDDFGHWEGAKKAVLEYFANNPQILLNRIDYTGRIGIKI